MTQAWWRFRVVRLRCYDQGSLGPVGEICQMQRSRSLEPGGLYIFSCRKSRREVTDLLSKVPIPNDLENKSGNVGGHPSMMC